MACSVPSCGASLRERGGLCHYHYCKWLNAPESCDFAPTGDYTFRGQPSLEARKERLMKKVTITESGCWLMRGPITGKSRTLWVEGKAVPIRLAFWLLFKAEAPPKKCVAHVSACQNPNCVAPGHTVFKDKTGGAKGKTWKWPAHRKAKVLVRATHCREGHEYTEENTMWVNHTKSGLKRRCRKCKSAENKRQRDRKKKEKEQTLATF